MGLFSTHKIFGIKIRESANDGSDFTNPDADYRMLFLGEDGTLKVKDSAGVVTGIVGAWSTYTPTWTASGVAPAIGNGTLSGRSKLLDSKTCIVQIFFQAGSTTTFGTGDWSFTLPAAAAAVNVQVLAGILTDSGTDNKLCAGRIASGASVVTLIPEGGNTVTATDPMTWAVNDSFRLNGIYELA